MLVQANARVPEQSRQLLLAVAARLRDDEKFHEALAAFLADATAAGSPFAERLDAIEARLAALEASGPVKKAVEPKPKPAPAPIAGEWDARAAAITLSTGDGKARRLTDEGNALFYEMVSAGVSDGEIGRVFGMKTSFVQRRKAKAA